MPDPSPGRIRITTPTRAGLLAEIETHFDRGEGFTLATLNLDHAVKLGRDTAFREAYLAQDLVVADGNPVVWLSRLAGREVELVPGSELIAPLAALAARKGVGVALFGASDDTLALAAERLAADHPGLRVVWKAAPPMGFDPLGAAARDYADAIHAAGAGLCFLALGAPKQEIFAAMAAARAPACGFVSIGAGLDFIAGHQVRAPVWVRKVAMEWAWRMASNPRRLARRYAECFVVLPGLAVSAIRERKGA